MDNPNSSSNCQSEGFNPTARPHIPYTVPNDPETSPSLSPSASSMNLDTPTSYTSILGSALAKKPSLAVTWAPLPLPERGGQKYVMVTEGVYIPSPGNASSPRQTLLTLGSAGESSATVYSPTGNIPSPSTSESSRSRLDPLASSFMPTPKLRIDVNKLFQSAPPSPSVMLPMGLNPPSLALSASLIASASNTQSVPLPSQNPRSNVKTLNTRASFPRDGLPNQSQSPAFPRQTDITSGVKGVGVVNKPQPTPRIPSSSPLVPALREALNASITSGRFADTKIHLFSHRNAVGDICKPKALYANSVVLKSVPYFDDLFSGNYSETTTKDLDEDVAEEGVTAEHYDYYSDSDLEDADDLQATRDSNDIDTTNSSGDYMSTYYQEKTREGRVIKVQDVAFITFQAFLLYLYTGFIEFATFGSEDNRRTRAAEIVSLESDHVPRPSPKSIYRLADKYDVPALRDLAFRNIKEGLEHCDPVRETLSRFASYYPEILGMHVENLASILTGVDSGEVLDQVDEQLQGFAEGEIGHASEAISSLWRTLTRGGGRNATRDTRSDTRPPLPTESSPLSIALIKSIRQGLFCDRRYLAKREDSGKWRSPVYISSIVLGDVEWYLNTLVIDPECGAEDSGDDCDSDSDYEDATEGTMNCIQEHTGDHFGPQFESVMPAALSVGAFSTWKTLFFYLYAGRVQFALLKSNGVEARTEYVKQNWKPGNPPLCSPKSVCYLAGKLGLQHLENAALRDVIAKTSATNIVEETFSKSTARLPRVHEVECQLLLSSSRDDEIAKATEEQIHSLADGQMPHGYATLSLGFRMAVEAKRMHPLGIEASHYLCHLSDPILIDPHCLGPART